MIRCQPWLGTLVEITAAGADAISAGFAAIAAVHAAMNVHDANSELSIANRIASASPIVLSHALAAVVARGLFWSRLSDGAFDAAGGDWRRVHLDGRALRLASGVQLDLSGIAKGFAVDRAIHALRRSGCRAGLVNAGGDMRGFGAAPWCVTLVRPERTPLAQVQLRNRALATSAAHPGGSLAHLPGHHPGLVSVSVEARRAIDADALAKIVIAGSPHAVHCLAAVGARALTLDADGTVAEVGARR